MIKQGISVVIDVIMSLPRSRVSYNHTFVGVDRMLTVEASLIYAPERLHNTLRKSLREVIENQPTHKECVEVHDDYGSVWISVMPVEVVS